MYVEVITCQISAVLGIQCISVLSLGTAKLRDTIFVYFVSSVWAYLSHNIQQFACINSVWNYMFVV